MKIKIKNLQNLKLRKLKNVEGYFMEDIEKILTKEQYKDFMEFMYGQTIMIIRKKDFVYRWDLERFIYGMDPIW